MRGFVLASLAVLFCASIEAQLLCESPNGGYRECRVGTAGVLALVGELSEGRCVEGVSWGTVSTGVVWVDRGCRGRFILRDSNVTPGSRRVVCESQKGERQVCAAELEKASDRGFGVYLVRQLSAARCDENETWGYDDMRDQIWVDKGCRAEFIIGARYDPKKTIESLDNLLTCESANGKKVQCTADTSAGVRIVRPLTESVCRYGKEWGYDAKGIWVSGNCRAEFAVRGKPKPVVTTLSCETPDAAKVQCPAETRYGVALIRQLGESYCILGRTWDFDAAGVWVSEGCRAQFALGGYRLPTPNLPPNASKVVCEAKDGQRIVCAADASRGVGLLRQLSDADCVLNHTWGYTKDGVWVEGGCKAEFAVAK
jgi:ribosomal protein L37AE/L43A